MSISEEKINYPLEILNYEKKIYDQRQLIEISRALNSTLDYKKLINSLTDICLAQVQTLSAALFLLPDMDLGYLTLDPDYKGFDAEKSIEYYKLNLESSLLNLISNNKEKGGLKAYTIEELDKLDFLKNERELQILKELGAHLIVPMYVKESLIGVIILGSKIIGDEYTKTEMEFLINLASLGAIAVYNAWLYERATVDMMTGLKNHAYLQSRLKDEREKAYKQQTNLYFMLTDVDKFKNFNDTYGHQAGDEVLKAVAGVLQSIAKKNPNFFAARYGGEEFCLVMPSLKKDEEAIELGEEFRKNVENLRVYHEGKELKVTASAGISKFRVDQDLKTNKNMIERADQALYECKRRGRNKVLFYDLLDKT